MAAYYAESRERTGFRDFYGYLESEAKDIAHLLRPFATGSLRHLLSDDGDDLLTHEALVTVFDLHLLELKPRPAAMVAIVSSTCWCFMPFGTRRPLDDHGVAPLVLVVFHEDLAATHFLRVAKEEMDRLLEPILSEHRARWDPQEKRRGKTDSRH